jgi:hypothetical protein
MQSHDYSIYYDYIQYGSWIYLFEFSDFILKYIHKFSINNGSKAGEYIITYPVEISRTVNQYFWKFSS